MKEIKNSEIRKIQRKNNFEKSIFIYIYLFIIGILFLIADLNNIETFITKGMRTNGIGVFCIIIGMIGAILRFLLKNKSDENMLIRILKHFVVLCCFFSPIGIDIYIFLKSDVPEYAFMLFACIVFILIIVFDIPRFAFYSIFFVFSVCVFCLFSKMLSIEMQYIAIIYTFIMCFIERVVDVYSLQNMKQKIMLENYNLELIKKVKEQDEKNIQIQNKIINDLAGLIENRDSDTGTHVIRTQEIVKDITDYMKEHHIYEEITGKNNEYIDLIIKAVPLHDVGKIAISDMILNKPGKLDKEEFEMMKTHTTKGAEILDNILTEIETDDYIEIAKNIALYHHERIDGKGYPQGLKGDEIPLSARIMAIADVYDALVSKRLYKEAFSKEKAIEIMKEGRGTQFDPILLDIFINEIVPKY